MAAILPTGLVSFLFTDVEGSTRLWESNPQGMAASLALHDEVMQSVADSLGGHVFSTAGDAFAVAFQTCEAAIAAATKIQLDLLSAQWPGPAVKVRIGIHTGTAEERAGDYFGPVLNRAARIMSAGNGGQVLVSSITAETMASTLAAPSSLEDLGTHHLKDIEEPEHLFELRHAELPVIDTPIRTVDIRRHNLPEYLTTFVGRSSELAEIDTLSTDSRLAVLTGVGGTGKTRLAVEAARPMADELADGAWLVELAPITNPAFIMSEIGDAWGLRAGEGATIEDVVTRYLWAKELLLVIDNCEHLLDGATAAIKLILESCPNVRIVATSRESLGIAGEEILRVPSLGLPDETHQLEDSEAVMLFLDRARSATADFSPTHDDLAAIGRIVTRIDGIPLGLELAAARLRSMSPAELADRLDHSFRILSGSAKTALPRQRTLAATIDWSNDLLKPAERDFFHRLSVFVGGFDLAAAEAVCVGGEVEEWEVLDHLDSLVDKSLVTVVPDSEGGTRYRLLEPVRQYAQEQFAESGNAADYLMAHAHYFVDLVAGATSGFRGPDRLTQTATVDLEYDNIRAGFMTLFETADIDAYLSMVFDLMSYWMHGGKQVEAIDVALQGLEAASEDTDTLHQIKAWWSTAILGGQLTSPEAIGHARTGLALAQETGDLNAIAKMELAVGAAIRHSTADPEYLEHLLEGRKLLDANPQPPWFVPEWERGVLNLLLFVYLPAEDERVREHLDIALAMFEAAGDDAMLAVTLSHTTRLYGSGDPDNEQVLANVERACEIFSESKSPNHYGHALYYLGILRQMEGDHSEALEPLAQGAKRLEDVGDLSCWAGALRFMAMSEAALGNPDPARKRVATVIDTMPVLPMHEVVKPRTLDAAAEVLTASGMYKEAATALGRAVASELPGPSVIPRDGVHESVRDRLVEQLGAEEVKRLEAEGAALEVDEILGKARGWLSEA
ncbi:MAG: adenylate/guanylate cyclase domain-containing protein [Acidimicrobiia bacterium]|nr:adenylate/guanylate cyclase domain-containing protein [Acidimicrobiia bacterium]